MSALQFDFPFVEVFRVTQFRFRPLNALDDVSTGGGGNDELLESSSEVKIDGGQQLQDHGGATSVWNCDGEVLDEPSIEFK